MHDLRTGTPRRSVDLTVLSGAAKQKMEEKAKVQRAIATLAVRSGKVELACDLLELSLTNEPLPPADEKAVLDVIAEIAEEHGVPTGKNEAVVVWRVRAAQYIVRVAKCAAPWPAVLVELTQPHKLEAAKKTESRPYYQGGRRLDARGAHRAGDCQAGAAVRRRDARRGEDLLQGRAGPRMGRAGQPVAPREDHRGARAAAGGEECAGNGRECLLRDGRRPVRLRDERVEARAARRKNRCYHLNSGIGMVMREAAAKGCFVLIDAIVAAGVCLFDSDENAHTPVLCAAEAGQAEMVAHLISKEIEQVAGHKGDPFAKNTSNTTSCTRWRSETATCAAGARSSPARRTSR